MVLPRLGLLLLQLAVLLLAVLLGLISPPFSTLRRGSPTAAAAAAAATGASALACADIGPIMVLSRGR